LIKYATLRKERGSIKEKKRSTEPTTKEKHLLILVVFYNKKLVDEK
jgi:hypothetical protein